MSGVCLSMFRVSCCSRSDANHYEFSKRVYLAVQKQAACLEQLRKMQSLRKTMEGRRMINGYSLDEAYRRCAELCSIEKDSVFPLGSLLVSPEKRRAVCALIVWCRRTDEIVDGPNDPLIMPTALDEWEKRLRDIFRGRPHDFYDAALSDTVLTYQIDMQPFMDCIEGMRMDTRKSRYKNFDELYSYCYFVAGTVALMTLPVLGAAPESKASSESICNAALALGVAFQLTNILRDVGEDAARGRIYLPEEELAQAGISEGDIFRGRVSEKWKRFMRQQMKKARGYYEEAEKGVAELSGRSRVAAWAILLLYKQILNAIEDNDYDTFAKRASVGKVRAFLSLTAAYALALKGP